MILFICACAEIDDTALFNERVVRIVVECPRFASKAIIPDEDALNDINLIVFENGVAEESFWKEQIDGPEDLEFEISMVKGREYSVCAVANIGRSIKPESMKDLGQMAYELQEKHSFDSGIPMNAYVSGLTAESENVLRLELVRMAAKISIRVDRSRLDEDVTMQIRNVRIGNFPRRVSIFGPSKALSADDVFETGFELTEDQCMALNTSGPDNMSGEVSLYMLENMHGDIKTASYVEMSIGYSSSELISYDSPLIYRFHLGENAVNLDIERNSHYHITILPENDGLSGDGWRVDKSGIGPSTPTFAMHPGEYVEGHVGDTIRVWCECYPKTSPFDPGREELEYDRQRGIYGYTIDEDNHGVTLYLRKPGTGIVYMSAGAPINRSGMVLICVNP